MFYTLPEKISKYVGQFTGRAWILSKILEWYENSSERMLLITGDPGTGKSMVAAWLAGSGPLPDELTPGAELPAHMMFELRKWSSTGTQVETLLPCQQLERIRSQVRAAHFCQADGSSVQPGEMSQNLADQLIGTLPGFDKELKNILSDRIVLNPVVNVNTVTDGGRVTGLSIGTINFTDLDDHTRFNRSFRDPLRNLYKHSNPEPILIVIDSLDEALSYSGEVKITDLLGTLSDLPYQVRILATSRPDPRLLKTFFQVPKLDLVDNAPPDSEDVNRYAYARLQRVLGEPQCSHLSGRVGQESRGVFLYGRLVVEDLLEELDRGSLPPDLKFPPGLSGYYNRFLERELGKDIDRWIDTYRPVLGTIAIAQGNDGLKKEQLEKITQQDVEKILMICLQYLDGTYPDGPFQVFHQSFVEFLFESKENKYYRIDASAMHAMIANYYYSLQDGTPPMSKWDDYALLYLWVHLEGASRLKDEHQRHIQVKRLVQLVQDPKFQKRFGRKVNDEFQMKHSMAAVRATATDTMEDALELLLSAIRHAQAHLHKRLQPGPVFELAEKGNLKNAVSLLEIYPVEEQWRRSASLVLAWLAADKRSDLASQQLLNIEARADCSELDLQLGERLRRVLTPGNKPAANPNGKPGPNWGPLPESPPREILDLLLRRMSGQTAQGEPLGNITSGFDLNPNPQIISMLGEFMQPDGGDEMPIFLAQQDGPFLVAYAVPEPNRQEGLHIFQQYVEMHAANPYLYYRNASLWLLIDSVLRHPDNEWTLQALKALFIAAFDVEGKAYEEGLELAVLALQQRAGQEQARHKLNSRRKDTLQRIQKLQDGRNQGDIWGVHKRRLSSLAQLCSVLPETVDVAYDMLNKAIDLPHGYAGFMYNSFLNLAEAVLVCGLEDRLPVYPILQDALTSAQNIQDSVFCARSTARVNAMMRRWWPIAEKSDLNDIVARFSLQSDASEFTALHVIGETFPLRENSPDKLSLSDTLLNSKTLSGLAEAFRLPLSKFLAVNTEKGWDANTILPNGTEVNVPDPKFAPLIAARLAAEVTVADGLFPNEKRVMIQSLTIPAYQDRTALDTVLIRLLLAAVPEDLSLLERLLPLARQIHAQFPDYTFGDHQGRFLADKNHSY